MIRRLKRADTAGGANRFVFRKDNGAAMRAPATVPTKEMQTVSRSRYPRPSFPAEKKKDQSGTRNPSAMFFKAAGLVREKSGGTTVSVQKRNRAAKAKARSRSALLLRIRSFRITEARNRLAVYDFRYSG